MTRRLITPVQARAEDTDPSEADRVDDWTGRRARAVAAGPSRLPELAQDDDGEDRDRFDAEEMSGEVEAYPAVLGRPYRMGFVTWHQLEPGAFNASIDEQDGRVPIYVQHSWDLLTSQPPIGSVSETAEVDFTDDEGDTRALNVAGRIWPDLEDGLAALHGLASGALREWSIAYLIQEFREEQEDEGDGGRRVIHVERADLWEVSVVLRGANPWTQTVRVAEAPTRVEGGGLDREWVAQMIKQSPSFARAFAANDDIRMRR